MDKYSRLGKNTALVFIGNGGAKVITFVMLPFYTRWLSVEGYGIADIISVYVTLLVGLTTACIADAIFIFPKDREQEKQKEYFSSGLAVAFFSLLLTALLFIIVVNVSSYIEIQNSLTQNIRLIYGLIAATFLQQYMQQFVRSIDKMMIYSTTGIVQTVGTALFSFIMIPYFNVSGYVFALIAANILAALYSLVLSGAFKYLSIKKIEKTVCAEMLKYSIPMIPNSVIWWLVASLNRPLMEFYLGMHAIGIFGVSNKFSSLLSALFYIFNLSWTISVVEEFNKEGYEHFYNKMLKLVSAGLMVLFFIITLSSKLLVTIFTTPDFFDAWKYIPILTLGAILASISSFVGCNFAAAKKSKYFFYSSILAVMVSITCNIILIPKFGIMGAAIAVPVSFSAIALSRILFSWKYVKINNIMHYIAMLFIGVSLIFVMLYIQNVGLKIIVSASLFALIVIMNYGLKNDVVKGMSLIKLKVKNINKKAVSETGKYTQQEQ